MTVQSPLSGLIRFKDSLPSSLWSFVIPTERSPNSAITASIDPRLDIVEQGPFSSVLALHSCQGERKNTCGWFETPTDPRRSTANIDGPGEFQLVHARKSKNVEVIE
ncbi:hypothetical protein QR680_009532 [Steinernema hermaphroditum]|uniref:Uncharacterized protein n=1 Tax=Steinernema hermaphroditum TaxID=289476 RepID=A0AA39MA44_9BILA|nr:hypothetical protein QR680_009532 [Steinernema hermaphroditum]